MTTIYNGHKISQGEAGYFVDDNFAIEYADISLAKERIDMEVSYDKKKQAQGFATYGGGRMKDEPQELHDLENKFKL